ncbi:Uncharacterized protein BM_BM1990 [Brugia malayi]|uniref:Uncharacterized protein n=1 Tax=Brugia malayi TaxID=6279 RepID=A0A4E9EPL8_BRUMA|nr:Uncharacterized protein BM_BM1990 [Brugia malayi]VIO86133.1 Uncharacterized protein BM_BM1990 [Brugia malayi]
MNGEIMHAAFIDAEEINGPVTDPMPKTIQFNESCENYRCLCNCFHIKTGALIVAGACDSYVMQSSFVSMICIAISFLAVLLLFVGLIRNIAAFLIPHLIVQIIVVLILAFGLTCGIIAFSTNITIFYRLMNAASFKEYPGTSTVALDAEITARFITIFILYLICLILQCWYLMIIHNCYRYLKERCRYMHYCLTFTTPMQTLIFR